MSLPRVATRAEAQLLDLTALGRQEEWEQPADRAASVRSGHPDFAT